MNEKILLAYIDRDFNICSSIIERLRENKIEGVKLVSLECLSKDSQEKIIADLVQRTKDNTPILYKLKIPEASYEYLEPKPSQFKNLEKIKQIMQDDLNSKIKPRDSLCPVNNSYKNYSNKPQGYFRSRR